MIDKLYINAGAMKAGTTWLFKQLRPHPNIYFTPIKELCYFSYVNGVGKQLSQEIRQRRVEKILKFKVKKKTIKWCELYAQAGDPDDHWYCSLFKQAPDDAYCADFSNLYALLPETALLDIPRLAKQIKVTYTLRDPLDRLWSHVKFHYQYIGDADGVERMSDKKFSKFISKPNFWDNANYLVNYKKLVKVFGKERVQLFYLEDFVAFPQGSLWDLEKFLDIPHVEYSHDVGDKKVNRSKDMGMPETWREIALEKLIPIYEDLYAEGLHHPSWRW